MRYHDWSVHDPEAWSAIINTFVPMDQRYHGRTWQAKLTAQATNSYCVLRWIQNGSRTAYRTPSQIRREPGDQYYWIVVPTFGVYAIRNQREETRVPPGHASIMSLNESCRLHIPDTDVHAFQAPRASIDDRVQPSGPLRVVLDLRTGLGRVTADMIRSLHAEQDRLSDREFNAVCERISELLSMLTVGDMHPQQDHIAATAEVIKRYVREHVGRDDLHLPSVARALGWSPRQVRFVLQQTGTTFRDLRQEESLRAARDMLQDPACQGTAISDIAARVGFTPTWFSAAFKARYGEAPREFRQRRTGHDRPARLPR